MKVETGLSSVPESLKGTYASPRAIEEALRANVLEALPNAGEQIAVYDVTLQYKSKTGVWRDIEADAVLPEEGVTVTLPWPGGAVPANIKHTVRHMRTAGDHAGEIIEEQDCTPVQGGLRCTFRSLSPVAMGYEAAAEQPGRPSGGGSSSGGSGASTYAVTVEKPKHGKVTVSRPSAASGNTVTLTVTPDSGYQLDSLTVTYAKGKTLELTDKGGGTYTFKMPGSKVRVEACFVKADGSHDCPALAFGDLDSSAWYHEAVDYVLSQGIMGGYSDGAFKPDRVLSRAQLAQIRYNIEGKPAVTGASPFDDVADGAWCADAVLWANQRGVVGGYGDGTFRPNAPITREQLAVMLWRYAKAKGGDVSVGENTNILSYTDFDRIGEYAIPALQWAAGSGVVNDYADGSLKPKGQATRAQTAAMLTRYMKGLKG